MKNKTCNRTACAPEFHVKSSEWKKMPAKTKAALAEMVKCAAKMAEPDDGSGDTGCDVNIGQQNEQADDHE